MLAWAPIRGSQVVLSSDNSSMQDGFLECVSMAVRFQQVAAKAGQMDARVDVWVRLQLADDPPVVRLPSILRDEDEVVDTEFPVRSVGGQLVLSLNNLLSPPQSQLGGQPVATTEGDRAGIRESTRSAQGPSTAEPSPWLPKRGSPERPCWGLSEPLRSAVEGRLARFEVIAAPYSLVVRFEVAPHEVVIDDSEVYSRLPGQVSPAKRALIKRAVQMLVSERALCSLEVSGGD